MSKSINSFMDQLNRLDERTLDNMNVLRDCVDLLLSNLPYQFKANSSVAFVGRELSGLNNLIKKYSGTQYEPVLKALQDERFIFKNLTATENASTMGAYSSRPVRALVVNVSGFMASADQVSREAVLAHRIPQALKSFRAILLHELRHLFQAHLYSKFFHDDTRESNYEYKTDPVEIDAAWSHHLEDFLIANYPTARAYVDAVMASFAAYKKLNTAQTKHYRNKTATYYYESTRGGRTDTLTQPAMTKLVAMRAKTRDWLVKALSAITKNDYDLRQIDGYDPTSSRFLLRPQAVQATAAMIAQGKPIPPTAAAIAFLIVGLVTPPEAAPSVKRYLNAVQKITVNDALTAAPKNFEGGWDVPAVTRFIQRVFA